MHVVIFTVCVQSIVRSYLHILILLYRIIVILDKVIRIFNFTRIPQELHQIKTAPNPRGNQKRLWSSVCVRVCACVGACVCAKLLHTHTHTLSFWFTHLMHVYIYPFMSCVHVCVHSFVCPCVCTCLCVCMCMHVCACVCVRVHVCVCMCVHVWTRVRMRVHVCMCVYTCVHVCVCVATCVLTGYCTKDDHYFFGHLSFFVVPLCRSMRALPNYHQLCAGLSRCRGGTCQPGRPV